MVYRTHLHRPISSRITLIAGLVAMALMLGTLQPDAPQAELAAVHQRAIEAGSYSFIADIEQTLIPRPLPGMIGQGDQRVDIRIEGEATSPDQARLELRLEGGGTDIPPLILIQDGAETYLLRDGERIPVENPAGLVAPASDYLGYLAVAENIRPADGVTPEGYTRYTYTINGPRLAEHVRSQWQAQIDRGEREPLPSSMTLQPSPVLQHLSGSGETWVDADGLPRRQILDLAVPEASDEYDAQVHMVVDYGFGSQGVGAAGSVAYTAPPVGFVDAVKIDDILEDSSTLLLAIGSLVVLLAVRQRRRVYGAVAITVCLSLIVSPVLQSVGITLFQARQVQADEETLSITEALGVPSSGADQAGGLPPAARNGSIAQPTADSAPSLNQMLALQCGEGGTSVDTDADGLNDAAENCLGTDPYSDDSDLDLIPDKVETDGFTYGGQTWRSDPLNPDTNGDGLDDTHEWPAPLGTAPDLAGVDAWDPDGDGIPNLWDNDNDGDGVPDGLDLSPYSFTVYQESFALSTQGGGFDGYQYIEFQVQPEAEAHLRYSLSRLDWPQDDQGPIQDVSGQTPGDLRLVPMLEIETNTAPDSDLQQLYHVSAWPTGSTSAPYRMYVPLLPISDGGRIVSFSGKVGYGPDQLDDVRWQSARIAWLVDALSVGPVATYYETRFRVTGLQISMSRDFESVILGESGACPGPDPDRYLFNVLFGLSTTFLRNQNPDLAEVNVRFSNPDVSSDRRWGLPSGCIAVDHDTYGHRDAGIADLGAQIEGFLNGHYASDSHPSLVLAFETDTGFYSLDDEGVVEVLGRPNVNLANIDLFTQRELQLQMYEHSASGWGPITGAEKLAIIGQHYPDLDAVVAGLNVDYPDLTADDLLALTDLFYTTWEIGRSTVIAMNGQALVNESLPDEEVTALYSPPGVEWLPVYLLAVGNFAEEGAGLRFGAGKPWLYLQAHSQLAADLGFVAGSVDFLNLLQDIEPYTNIDALLNRFDPTGWNVFRKILNVELRSAGLVIGKLSINIELFKLGSKVFKLSHAVGVAGFLLGTGLGFYQTWLATEGMDKDSTAFRVAWSSFAVATAVGLALLVISIALGPAGWIFGAALLLFFVLDLILSETIGFELFGTVIKTFYSADAAVVKDFDFTNPGVSLGGQTGLVGGNEYQFTDQFVGVLGWQGESWRAWWWGGWAEIKGYYDPVPGQSTVTGVNRSGVASCTTSGRDRTCTNSVALRYVLPVAGQINARLVFTPRVYAHTYYLECILWGICWADYEDHYYPNELDNPWRATEQYIDVLPSTLNGLWNWSAIGNPDDDGDGLGDDAEAVLGTNKDLWDSDGDGLSDPVEIDLGADPHSPDSDGDTLDDGLEYHLGTPITVADTDGDGLTDKEEIDGWAVTLPGISEPVWVFSDPLTADADGDGLIDSVERSFGASPYAYNVAPHLALTTDQLARNPAGADGVYLRPGDTVAMTLTLDSVGPRPVTSPLELCLPDFVTEIQYADQMGGDRTPPTQRAGNCLTWSFTGEYELLLWETATTTVTATVDAGLGADASGEATASLPYRIDVGGTAQMIRQGFPIVVDTGSPDVTITEPLDGVLLGGGISHYVIGGTAHDSTSWVREVQVELPGVGWVSAEGTRRWAYTWELPVDGAYTLRARAYDYPGNTSAEDTVQVTVDNTPPVVSLALDDLVQVAGRYYITGTTDGSAINITLTGQASDNLSGLARVQVSIDDRPWREVWTASSRGMYVLNELTWSTSWGLPGASAQGEHRVTVRAFDQAGNERREGPVTITVDVVPPTDDLTDRTYLMAPPHVPAGEPITLRGVANDAGNVPPSPRPVELAGTLDAINDATIWLGQAAIGDSAGGVSATWLGDFNGDRLADLAVGLPAAADGAGQVTVVYGRAGGWPVPAEMAMLADSRTSFVGVPDAGLGAALASAGDVNGDGFSDLLVNDPADNRLFLVFGQPTAMGRDLLLDSPQRGRWAVFTVPEGETIGRWLDADGAAHTDGFGAAGDVNGDGYDDLLIGASGTEDGAVYLLLGHPYPLLEPVLLPTQAAAVITTGPGGARPTGVGDRNGDQHDDFVVVSGNTIYLFNGTGYSAQAAETLTLDAAAETFTSLSTMPAVAALGDVDGDAKADFIYANGTAPRLVYSSGQPSPGFAFAPAPSGFLAAPGDVDGDGVADLLMGNATGDAYLILGADTGRIAARLTGVAAAASVPYAAGGDLNSDGSSDLLLVPVEVAGEGPSGPDFGDLPYISHESLPQATGQTEDQATSLEEAVVFASGEEPSVALYVDDDYGAGRDNDGHTWGVDAFDNIPGAIDAVDTPGDTVVIVMPGVYPPFVIGAGKDFLTVQGVNTDAVFVDGGGGDYAVHIANARGVHLSNLTLRNAQHGVWLENAGVGGYENEPDKTTLDHLLIYETPTSAVYMDRTSTLTLSQSTLAGGESHIEVYGDRDPALAPNWEHVLTDPRVVAGEGGGMFAADDGIYFVPGGGSQDIYRWGSMVDLIPGLAQISVGTQHICGLKNDGTLQCWGWDDYGQVSGPNASPDTFTQISAIMTQTCGLRDNGTLHCWGWDMDGAISGPNASPDTFTQVSSGYVFTCGLRDDGTLQCWGWDSDGSVLGPNASPDTFTQVSAGIIHTCGLRDNGTLQCWGPDFGGSVLGPNASPDTFTQVSAGNGVTCGLRDNGTLQCWGWDADGQVSGPNASTDTFTQVSAGGEHTCGLRDDGRITCWGDDAYECVSGPNDSLDTFTQVSAGHTRTCGLRSDGMVVCWEEPGFLTRTITAPVPITGDDAVGTDPEGQLWIAGRDTFAGAVQMDGEAGYVYAVTTDGDDVYVGGDFVDAGGDPEADRIARWNASDLQWHSLGSGVGGYVQAIATAGEDIYVGGVFATVVNPNGEVLTVNNIARWNKTDGQWHALGSGVNGMVWAIAAAGENIYIGGEFGAAGGAVGTNNVARWNTTDGLWHPLANGLNNIVSGFAVDGANIYISGRFSDAGGIAAADGIVRWNQTAQQWYALGGGVEGSGEWWFWVRCVAATAEDIYIGGMFYNVVNPGGQSLTVNGTARWNKAEGRWYAMGGGVGTISSMFGAGPHGIAVGDDGIYVGGDLITLFNPDGTELLVNNIARWSPEEQQWYALGQGLAAGIEAVASDGENVYVGTEIQEYRDADPGTLRWDGSSWWTRLYGFDGSSWVDRIGPPLDSMPNARIVGVGSGTLYLMLGDGTLFEFSVDDNTWTRRTDILFTADHHDFALAWAGDSLYAYLTNDQNLCRYLPDEDSWDCTLQEAPADPGPGAALAWDGGQWLYAMPGSDSRRFWRYDIGADQWEILGDGEYPYDEDDDTPAEVNVGSGLVRVGDDLYFVPGVSVFHDLQDQMWRYGPVGVDPVKLTLDRVAFVAPETASEGTWLSIGDDPGGGSSSLPYDFRITGQDNAWVGGSGTTWSLDPAEVPWLEGSSVLTHAEARFLDPDRDVYRVGAESGLADSDPERGYRGYHAYRPDAVVGTVEAEFTSIQAAIDSGANRVLVQPGVYHEPFYLVSGVQVMGAGAERIIIEPELAGDPTPILVQAEGVVGARLSGVTLSGDGQVDGLEVEGRARHTTLTRSIIRGTDTGIQIAGEQTDLEVVNNTIVGNATGLLAADCAPVDVRNTLFAYNTGAGLQYAPCSAPARHFYNLYWTNGTDIDDGTENPAVGMGELFMDPLFIDSTVHDYRTVDWSPVIDAGNPKDPAPPGTGGRVDIGYLEQGRAAFYVDDDYCEFCLNDGLTWGLDAFVTIPEALDAAAAELAALTFPDRPPSYVVGVGPGSYVGGFSVPSYVRLVGSGADVTIIKSGSGESVITFDGVVQAEVRGFTLLGAGQAGVTVSGASNAIVISRNVIWNNATGVVFTGQATGQVVFNTLVANTGEGISSSGDGTWVIVENNILYDNGDGLLPLGGGQVFDAYNLVDVNPLFADDQYHLQADSPAVDAASPFVEAPPGGGERADMGCYEVLSAPLVLFLGREGVSTTVGNSGVSQVEMGVTLADPAQGVEETLPPEAGWNSVELVSPGHTVSYWHYPYTTPDAEGLYRVYSRATDMVGNQEADPAVWFEGTFIVDDTPPVVEWLSHDQYGGAVELRAQASDYTSGQFGIWEVGFEIDGEPYPAQWAAEPWDPAQEQPRVFRAWIPLEPGQHSISAVARDRAGHEARVPISLTVVDLGGVDVDIPSLDVQSAQYDWQDQIVTFAGTASDDDTGLASVEVSVDGGYTWMPAPFTDDDWTFIWHVPDKQEYVSYPVRVRARDRAGNTAFAGLVVTVDNVYPALVDPIEFSVPEGTHFDSPPAVTVDWHHPPVDGSGTAHVHLVLDDLIWEQMEWEQIADILANTPEAAGTSAQLQVSTDGTWYIHLAVQDDAGNTLLYSYGPLYVGTFAETAIPFGERRQSIQIDGLLDVAHDEWLVESEFLDDDERGQTQQALYTTWDGSALYLGWQGAWWTLDGTLWAYVGTGTGGTDQPVNPLGSGPLPFAADYAVEITGPDSGRLWQYEGGWHSVELDGQAFAQGDSGGTEVRLPLDMASIDTLQLIAFAVEDDGMVWSVFPTTNPLGGPWLQAYSWSGLSTVFTPNASQPRGTSVQMELYSPQAPEALWGPGDVLTYVVSLTNHETRTVEGLQLVFTASPGLTYTSPGCLGSTCQLDIPALPPGETHLVTVSGTLASDLGDLTAVTSTVTLEVNSVRLDEASLSHRIDGQPPSVQLNLLPGNAIGPGWQTLSGTADDGDGSGVAEVLVRPQDGDWLVATGTRSWTGEVHFPDIPEGQVVPFALEVQAVDAKGNRTTMPYTLNVDTVGPVLDTIEVPTSLSGGYTVVQGTAHDPAPAGSQVIRVEVQVDEEQAAWQPVSGPFAPDAEGRQSWAFIWEFPADDNLAHRLRVRAFDAAGNETISDWVEVVSVNHPPEAVDDAVTTNEDTAVTIDVLANDGDVDGDNLVVAAVTQGGHGTVVRNTIGVTFIYTPVADFCGADSFTYTVSDGRGGTDMASVSVEVACVNDPPKVTNPGDQTNAEGDTIHLLIGATDIDSDTLTFDATGLPPGLSLNPASGEITGTLGYQAAGTYAVTVTASDGALSNSETFHWLVADTPVCDEITVTVTLWSDDVTANGQLDAGEEITREEDPAIRVEVIGHGRLRSGDTFTVSPGDTIYYRLWRWGVAGPWQTTSFVSCNVDWLLAFATVDVVLYNDAGADGLDAGDLLSGPHQVQVLGVGRLTTGETIHVPPDAALRYRLLSGRIAGPWHTQSFAAGHTEWALEYATVDVILYNDVGADGLNNSDLLSGPYHVQVLGAGWLTTGATIHVPPDAALRYRLLRGGMAGPWHTQTFTAGHTEWALEFATVHVVLPDGGDPSTDSCRVFVLGVGRLTSGNTFHMPPDMDVRYRLRCGSVSSAWQTIRFEAGETYWEPAVGVTTIHITLYNDLEGDGIGPGDLLSDPHAVQVLNLGRFTTGDSFYVPSDTVLRYRLWSGGISGPWQTVTFEAGDMNWTLELATVQVSLVNSGEPVGNPYQVEVLGVGRLTTGDGFHVPPGTNALYRLWRGGIYGPWQGTQFEAGETDWVLDFATFRPALPWHHYRWR